MKYHRLNIYTDGTFEMYSEISKTLGVRPTEFPKRKVANNPYGLWTYTVDTPDEAPYYDFINEFLNILEPKFSELEQLDISKDKITFWLLYEYDQQCGMEYHPQEMKRLGESGIVLCIDCWQRSEETEATA